MPVYANVCVHSCERVTNACLGAFVHAKEYPYSPAQMLPGEAGRLAQQASSVHASLSTRVVDTV